MIAGLKGKIHTRGADEVIIDVGGVYYSCIVSLSTLSAVGEVGDEVELIVHTHVREDALQLFGFSTMDEKRIFLALVSVSGIGPKLAQNILSGLPVDELGRAVVNGDVVRLTKIPGVGKKTAERIVLELKEKLIKVLALTPEDRVAATGFVVGDELVSALANLGYKPKQVDKIVARLEASQPADARLEDLIRAGLRELQS